MHDAQIQGGVRGQQEVGLLPQLHGARVVLLELLVVPGQRVDGGNETLQEERGGEKRKVPDQPFINQGVVNASLP